MRFFSALDRLSCCCAPLGALFLGHEFLRKTLCAYQVLTQRTRIRRKKPDELQDLAGDSAAATLEHHAAVERRNLITKRDIGQCQSAVLLVRASKSDVGCNESVNDLQLRQRTNVCFHATGGIYREDVLARNGGLGSMFGGVSGKTSMDPFEVGFLERIRINDVSQ
jgi:hypothetical protein